MNTELCPDWKRSLEMVEKLKVIHVGIHFNPLRGGGNLRNSRLICEYVQNYAENVSIYSYPYHGFDYVNDHERINLIYLKSAFEQVWKARMDAGDRYRQVIMRTIHVFSFSQHCSFGGQELCSSCTALRSLVLSRDFC